MEYIQQNKKKLPKATEPDTIAKGLQSRTTFKNGILDGRNKNRLLRQAGRLSD